MARCDHTHTHHIHKQYSIIRAQQVYPTTDPGDLEYSSYDFAEVFHTRGL